MKYFQHKKRRDCPAVCRSRDGGSPVFFFCWCRLFSRPFWCLRRHCGYPPEALPLPRERQHNPQFCRSLGSGTAGAYYLHLLPPLTTLLRSSQPRGRVRGAEERSDDQCLPLHLPRTDVSQSQGSIGQIVQRCIERRGVGTRQDGIYAQRDWRGAYDTLHTVCTYDTLHTVCTYDTLHTVCTYDKLHTVCTYNTM
jgi:hypothetical protein